MVTESNPLLGLCALLGVKGGKIRLGVIKGVLRNKGQALVAFSGQQVASWSLPNRPKSKVVLQKHVRLFPSQKIGQKTFRKRPECIPDACKAHWTAPGTGLARSEPLKPLKRQSRQSQELSWSLGRGRAPIGL